MLSTDLLLLGLRTLQRRLIPATSCDFFPRGFQNVFLCINGGKNVVTGPSVSRVKRALKMYSWNENTSLKGSLHFLGSNVLYGVSIHIFTFFFLKRSGHKLSVFWGQYISSYMFSGVFMVSPGGEVVKNSSANAGDAGSIPDLGRPPGVGNGDRSSVLAWKIPWTDRGAWQATVHGLTKSQTQLSDWAHTHTQGVFIQEVIILDLFSYTWKGNYSC